ncbi:MAG: DUF4360 domain-containing protein [Devosia sp.]
MKTALATLFAALSLLAASPANADSIKLGIPTYGGPGCPQGTASISLSGDTKSLSVQFSQYSVKAGGSTGKTFDRKACSLTIPVHVPQGYSVSVLAIDYRGYNNLPSGAKSTFQVEYFFAGGQGPIFKKDYSGPNSGPYLISNKLTQAATVWSACGTDVNLRTNSSIRVTTSQNKSASASVAKANVKAAMLFKLSWKKC